MLTMSRRSIPLKAIFLILSIFFLDFYILFGYFEGLVFTSSDSTLLFFVSTLVVNLFLIFPLMTKRDGASFYSILYITVYLIALVIFVGNLTTTLLIVPSICASFLALFTLRTRYKVTKGISLVAVLVFMDIIGKVLVISPQQVPGPLTIQLLADRLTTVGLPVPATEYFGLFISTRYLDFITGPFEFLLFFFISSLLVENYHRIILLLTGKRSGLLTAGYGAVSALGCQCESAIGIFPAATLLVFNILLVPFLLLSVVLLVLTYLMIVRYYEPRRLPKFPHIFSLKKRSKVMIIEVLIVLSQVLVVAGIFLRLQDVPIFLFGTSMEMILNGFLAYYLVYFLLPRRTIGPLFATILLLLSVISVLVWFIPEITLKAVTNPFWFSAMSYSAFTAGFMISTVYFSSPPAVGTALVEAFAVSLGIVPIVVYYVVFSLQRSIWSFWTAPQQADLSIVLWIVMLPFMWLSTQKSLFSTVQPHLSISTQRAENAVESS
jgi:hypothetical protein